MRQMIEKPVIEPARTVPTAFEYFGENTGKPQERRTALVGVQPPVGGDGFASPRIIEAMKAPHHATLINCEHILDKRMIL